MSLYSRTLMWRTLMKMEYTTSDSEEDPDYDPREDPDYESGDEETPLLRKNSESSDSDCFDNILAEKDREIEELKKLVEELSEKLKSKLNAYRFLNMFETPNKTKSP